MYGRLGNGVENNPFGLALVQFQPFRQVPRNSLSLTILIRCQVQVVAFLEQIAQLGKEIKGNEIRLEDLGKENKELGDTLAQLKSPQVLDQLVQQWHLDLVMPRPHQVVVLKERDIIQPAKQSRDITRTASR